MSLAALAGTRSVADAVRFTLIGDSRGALADAVRFVANDAEAASIHYVHADHLGAPRKMTGATGAVTWNAVFSPFGEEDSILGVAANDNRFPGQRHDAETGLNYNIWRDYDPSLGRYLQSDPIGLGGGLNTYAYVGGNPLRYTDPTGQNPAVGCAVGLPLGGPVGCAVGAGVAMVGTRLAVTAFAAALSAITRKDEAARDVAPKMCRAPDDEMSCNDHMTQCLQTSMADFPVESFTGSRCMVCRDQCVRDDGVWPLRTMITNDILRCDYWNFP